MKKRLISLALTLCLAFPLLPGALAAGGHPFTDVPASHWASDAVTYVYENDLMDGVDSTTFSPDGTTTRAMVVTVLYRLAGQPAADWANPFVDVPAGVWFHDAVTWAPFPAWNRTFRPPPFPLRPSRCCPHRKRKQPLHHTGVPYRTLPWSRASAACFKRLHQ